MNATLMTAVAAAVILSAMSPASAETKITAGTEATEGSLVFDIMKNFETEIEARSGGEVDFVLVPGGQLGKDIDVINGLRLGTHEMTLACSPVQSIEPKLGIFEAPFMITNREQAKAIALGPIGDELMASLTSKGVIGLTLTELGFRQITNNVRPIRTVEDIAGLKIRVPNSPFRQATYKALGANPTPIAFGETYAALRQGVVDGQENPLPSIFGAKFHEVQKYVTIANYLFTPCTIMASPTYFNQWSPEVQGWVRESARAAAEHSFVRGAELDEQYLAEMKKTSEVNYLDDPASFRAAVRPLWDEIAEKVGKDLMDRAIATVN
jgi:tripartite ATP-independent transporter DctP family solute receptor